ncbi:unnamed protein product, partial [Darwinula stevensoni]
MSGMIQGTRVAMMVGVISMSIAVFIGIILGAMAEVKVSVPTILLILSISAIMNKPSIFITMIVIGFLGWTGIAKYVRAELLKVRSLEFIEAAQALGLSEWRIVMKHAIPNS